MYNPFSLKGKTILVTGASSGIGAATAVECSKMGANVIVTGRNEERLKKTFDHLDISFGANHLMIIADLADETSVNSLVEQTGILDGVVNNAGVNRVKPVTFIKQDDFDYVFQSNAWAAVNLTRSLCKKKKLRKNSSIVLKSVARLTWNVAFFCMSPVSSSMVKMPPASPATRSIS